MFPTPRMQQRRASSISFWSNLDAVVPGLVSDIDGSVTYSASDDGRDL